MKKFIFLFITIVNCLNAQTGIHTNNPLVTLNIEAIANNSGIKDGILIPKITGDQLKAKTYTNDEVGTIIYVTSLPTGNNTNNQVQYINNKGFYYLTSINGALKWHKFKSVNYDSTNDEWVNNTSDVRIEKKANGTNKILGTEVAFTDSGNLGLGTYQPQVKIHMYKLDGYTEDDIKITSFSSDPNNNSPSLTFKSGKLVNDQIQDISLNETIGSIDFRGRKDNNFNTIHSRIFSQYKGTDGGNLILTTTIYDRHTLILGENQNVGVRRYAAGRKTLDVNGIIAHNELNYIVGNNNIISPAITFGLLNLTGANNANRNFYLAPGVNGQRLIITNSFTSNGGSSKIGNVVIYNRDSNINIINSTILPGKTKEFVFSNNSWRSLKHND